MHDWLIALARRIWPDLERLPAPDRGQLLVELAGVVFSLPLAAVSLAWLVAATDWTLLGAAAPALLLFLLLAFILDRLTFFQITGERAGAYSQNLSSLTNVVVIAAVFTWGPTAVWMQVAQQGLNYATAWPRRGPSGQRWNWTRNLFFNLWSGTARLLLGLLLYRGLGGRYPLAELTLTQSGPAFVAVTFMVLLAGVFFWFLIAFWKWLDLRPFADPSGGRSRVLGSTTRFFMVAEMPAFFGILAAVLFSGLGIGAFLFYMAGVLLISLMARRLSQALSYNQQHTREVRQLEVLGRALIAAAPDPDTLPRVLAEHVPRMFEYHLAEIRLYPDRQLLRTPEYRPAVDEAIWHWLQANPQAHHFTAGEPLPWSRQAAAHTMLLAPILSNEEGQALGGICMLQEHSYLDVSLPDIQPALQILAAQIASAVHSAQVYQSTLEHQRVVQELAFAGRIQASFLPEQLPSMAGWQLAAALLPARETSGDFYDAFALPNNQVAVLVADVADKGVGAALYMAQSRTLLRTYAYEYRARPDYVLRVTNRRILADSETDLFVSVFYGVIDPFESTLTYCNAGHNPPILLRRADDGPAERLVRTGMVLGVDEGSNWQQSTVRVDPGDTLVLYSDGITDAQNAQGDFFGEDRLLAAIQAHRQHGAQATLDAVLAAVQAFCGGAAQFDDITLMIVVRET